MTAPVAAQAGGLQPRAARTQHLLLPSTLPPCSLPALPYLEQVADRRDVIDATIHEGEDIHKAGSKKGFCPSLHPLLLHDWRGREGGGEGGGDGGRVERIITLPAEKKRVGGREG